MAFEKIVEAPIGHILFFKVNIRCHRVPNKEAGNIELMQQATPVPAN